MKVGSRPGARTSWGKSSDLRWEVELIDLSSPGIENRVICRAIDLQLVGWWATICLEPYQFLSVRLAARLVEGEMHLHPISDKDLKRDLVSEIASLAERLFCIPSLNSEEI